MWTQTEADSYESQMLHGEHMFRRCEHAVDELGAELTQFECADAADEWIAETARRIGGCHHIFTSISDWLLQLLEESGFIQEETETCQQ